MTRVTWATLLAFVAWLSAGDGSTRAPDRRPSSAAVAAIDAPTPPLAPRAHETLSLLLRHLALRGEEQRRHSRMRDAGGNAPALVAARLAAPRAAGVASDEARRHAPSNAAEALAFPYDATAPPPAGRRA